MKKKLYSQTDKTYFNLDGRRVELVRNFRSLHPRVLVGGFLLEIHYGALLM